VVDRLARVALDASCPPRSAHPIDSREEGLEFRVDRFDAASGHLHPGAGEVLKPLPDGMLSYTAAYSGTVGVLQRVE
jgi:hypothetical protein